MKLEEGMYVRYTVRDYQKEWTEIDKINEYVPQSGQLYLKNSVCVKSNVIKASHNIINLIEVGDYVNGLKITLINEPSMANCYKRIVYAEDEEGYLIKSFNGNEIKSIVTKEQFSQMEYKIGGNE